MDIVVGINSSPVHRVRRFNGRGGTAPRENSNCTARRNDNIFYFSPVVNCLSLQSFLFHFPLKSNGNLWSWFNLNTFEVVLFENSLCLQFLNVDAQILTFCSSDDGLSLIFWCKCRSDITFVCISSKLTPLAFNQYSGVKRMSCF